MSEKFPYGYDLNAYIDKAFEQMKRYKTINHYVMNEKFPYGYDLNAYIDKAFEQMKADFPWATRDMIAEHTCFGIEKVGDDYQYVRYCSYCSPVSRKWGMTISMSGIARIVVQTFSMWTVKSLSVG